MQFAQATHIPEMVQAVFYAMVINDAARLRLIRRETGESLVSDLWKLRWGVIEAWLLGDVLEGLAGPQAEGRHSQFPSLPAFIDGRVVAGVPERINVRRMAKTKSTRRIRSPDELLAKSTQGNPCSAPSSSKPGAEVASTSSSSTSGEASSSSSSDSSSRSSSSEGVSTSSSSPEGPSTPGESVLKRKGRAPEGLVAEIVVEGPEFPEAPTCSDLQDGSGSHFPIQRSSLR
ncbi:hypothetical protein Cgig2_002734 [Carnegiea gigantea]|uniref:Uncharacterized protein n=1 Tax=Carnegiea gigantea TaxID=171969 RepID=A0A9Q1GWV9_9CARY|nr:hypothetical protein Cgig2_002734 [Carnegiea gigantea]